MAALHSACRAAGRLTARHARRGTTRGFVSSSPRSAASNFVMPAMSPTMTEGNISSWKVKEGDKFSAGDVLLEIETDKAQMDVEAQDEGQMAKIIQGDGSKAVKVGARIAVLAEEGDDLSTLEIPPEEPVKSSQSDKQAEQNQSQNQSQEKGPDSSREPPAEKPPATSETKGSGKSSSGTSGSDVARKPRSQDYPLYPSVQVLLHQNGISEEEANKINATGPNGRLLKGDVLSYMGSIDKSYARQSSETIDKRAHLDLSNIEKVAPAKKPAPKESTKHESTPQPDTEIAVPISLEAVLATQKRIKDSLGLVLPLSTFIARASELANEELPRGKGVAPSADELFDAVLGLDKVQKTSRGSYIPHVTAVPANVSFSRAYGPPKKLDIIDLLSSKSKRAPSPVVTPAAADVAGPTTQNVFSVSVKAGDERRAKTYLERMKSVLEADPGRLVL